jgi:hypothetical protein
MADVDQAELAQAEDVELAEAADVEQAQVAQAEGIARAENVASAVDIEQAEVALADVVGRAEGVGQTGAANADGGLGAPAGTRTVLVGVAGALAWLMGARWRLTVAAGALVALATVVQLWFAPFVVGLALGVVLRRWRGRAAVGSAALATAVGWAIPLVARAVFGEPVLSVARVTAGLAGLPPVGALTVCATMLVAVVQGLVGVWFARAVSGLRQA